MRLIRPAVMLAGLVILSGGLQAAAQASPQSWSATDCQTCHEKAASAAFNKTAHAKLDQSCASCHQNVAKHLQGQMAGNEFVEKSYKNCRLQRHLPAPARRLHAGRQPPAPGSRRPDGHHGPRGRFVSDAYTPGDLMLPQSVLIFMKSNDGPYEANVVYAKLNYRF